MNLRSLECAIALADKGHFGRAASYLHTTQPALSQRIAALEDEVGHKLFIRSKSPVVLTAAGEALVRRARMVVDNAEAAKEEAKLAALGLSGNLRIGFTQIALYQNLPEMLSNFRQAFPAINIELKEQISLDQEQLLNSDDLDIGVVHPPLASNDLQVHYLDDSPLMLALPSHWHQASSAVICLSELSELPFILPPRYIGPTFYDGIIEAGNKVGFVPNVVQEAAPISTVIGLVSAGIGAGFITESFSVIKRPGVTFVKVKNKLPKLVTALAWKRDTSNPIITHFIETVEAREKNNKALQILNYI